MLEINHGLLHRRSTFRGLAGGLLLLCFLLTGCGASILDVTAKGDVGTLEIMLAESAESMQIRNDLGQSAIHYAALHNRLDSLKVLLAHQVDLNAQDGTGLTALHIAAVGDHVHIVRALIEAGAYTSIRDNFGDTALHSAAIHGSVRATKELLKAGLHVGQLNDAGLSSVDLARKFKHQEVVVILEEVLKVE